jgi:hypothetical protein
VTFGLLSQRQADFDQSVLHYTVPIVVAITVPLGIILLLCICLLILQLSKRLNGTGRKNERPSRKLRKRPCQRRSIERRIHVNGEPEDIDQISANDNDTLQDGINLSLLLTPHSTIMTHEESVSSAVSETFPLMRGSTPLSIDSSHRERPSTLTQLEELEQRVQRLEGRWSPLHLEEQESENRSAWGLPPEEQLPAYTSYYIIQD